MARRKKIPGKKHRGIKDPEAQKAQRELKLKTKVNAAPTQQDHQEMPRKMRILMDLKEQMKSESWNKTSRAPRKSKEEKNLLDSSKHMGYETKLPGMKKPLKPIPVFKQKPGESKKIFFNRMDKTVQAMLKRKEYERKYDVEVTDDPITGETIVKNREKDEIDMELEKLRSKSKLGKKRVKSAKSKEEKKKEKRLKEKERKFKKKRKLRKKLELQEEDQVFTQKSKPGFNEQVYAPPMLDRFSSKKISNDRKKSYLFEKMFDKANIQPIRTESGISLVKKNMLEQERERVITEYRKLKNNN